MLRTTLLEIDPKWAEVALTARHVGVLAHRIEKLASADNRDDRARRGDPPLIIAAGTLVSRAAELAEFVAARGIAEPATRQAAFLLAGQGTPAGRRALDAAILELIRVPRAEDEERRP